MKIHFFKQYNKSFGIDPSFCVYDNKDYCVIYERISDELDF